MGEFQGSSTDEETKERAGCGHKAASMDALIKAAGCYFLGQTECPAGAREGGLTSRI